MIDEYEVKVIKVTTLSPELKEQLKKIVWRKINK